MGARWRSRQDQRNVPLRRYPVRHAHSITAGGPARAHDCESGAWYHRADDDRVIQTTPRNKETFDVIELFYSIDDVTNDADDDVGNDVNDENNVITKTNLEEIKRFEDEIFASKDYAKMCNQVR